jgi:uncharacterized membrane protein YidH (DUF202 family)
MEEPIQPALESAQEDDNYKKKKKELRDEVSFEKIELSLYRAQLAMLRTATTMTTFGFALQRLLEEKMHDGKERPVLHFITPRRIAMALFFTGLIGLISYTIKHIKTLKRVNRFHAGFYFSGIMIMTYLLFTLTLMLFVSSLLG